MPITTSAKKALRQNIRRRERNSARKKELKNSIKQLKKFISQKNTELALQQLSLVYKKLDKAAKVNIIKKNTASRLKSRLTMLFNKTPK
jgi:small subunit ribosomal protein S20